MEYRRLRLYDGGAYDTLGLEALFDAGKLEAKHPGEAIEHEIRPLAGLSHLSGRRLGNC